MQLHVPAIVIDTSDNPVAGTFTNEENSSDLSPFTEDQKIVYRPDYNLQTIQLTSGGCGPRTR